MKNGHGMPAAQGNPSGCGGRSPRPSSPRREAGVRVGRAIPLRPPPTLPGSSRSLALA